MQQRISLRLEQGIIRHTFVLTVTLLETRTSTTPTKLLRLAPPRIRHQQSPIIPNQNILHLLLRPGAILMRSVGPAVGDIPPAFVERVEIVEEGLRFRGRFRLRPGGEGGRGKTKEKRWKCERDSEGGGRFPPFRRPVGGRNGRIPVGGNG